MDSSSEAVMTRRGEETPRPPFEKSGNISDPPHP